MIRVLAALLTALVAGCNTQIIQRVEGHLTVDGTPLQDGQVLLTRGNDKKKCPSDSPSAPVRSGSFSLTRNVHLGAFDVIVQNDALCIKEQGGWVVAWETVYGPAPETLTFICSSKERHWSCTVKEFTQ